LILLAALVLVNAPVHAESTARIRDTWPPTGATLGHNESFYVRIGYRSDEPISLWARPYRNGRPVEKTMSNASPKYMGDGEALGWFALIEPGEVDEVRILAGGGKPYREWELTRQGVQLSWTTANPASGTTAAWVEELKAASDARMREDAERRANEPVSLGEGIFFSGFMLLMFALGLAGITVPLWCVWKWRGGWRLAAAVPAGVVLFVVLRIVIDTARDPTSHNLWPFELLIAGTGALVAIGVLKLVRRTMRAEA
jgi:hypothetical protein